MNKTSFYTALENFNEIGNIESVVEEFPYFQTARLLYLKKLHNTEDIHFDKELKKTAVYAGDRKALYYLILHKEFTKKLVEIDVSISTELGNINPTTKEIEPKTEPSLLDIQIIEQVVADSIEKDVEEIIAEDASTKAEKQEEKSVEIDISSLSFTEWLKFTTGRGEKSSNQKSIENIIESFIESEPKIKTPKAEFFSPTELARKSIQDNEDFVTETLAKIYVAQGNYAKAIKAFERLSLNYPEKSTYFADQIKSVKDLIKEK